MPRRALRSCSAAAPAWAQDIGGDVEGTNLNGSPYKGTAKIVLTSETT